MTLTTEDTLPFHLKGNYAPVTEEVTSTELVVRGSIPTELDGLYVRNGANPQSGTSIHWFAGDGMLHGLRLRDGKAEWYRNRYVQTRTLAGESRMDAIISGDYGVSTANTHVIGHAGRILALEEGSLPTEVDGELCTVGAFTYGGKLASQMTAHPKVCAETGELHFFGYSAVAPFLTYHRADANGTLVQSEVIDVPGSTMIHDFAISRNHVVFLDLPVVFDMDVAISGKGFPFRWDPSYGARIGLMPRTEGSGNADVQWFEIEPNYVFHTMNAFDNADGSVSIDVGRHEYMWKQDANDFAPALLHRWTADPSTGQVKEEQLDDRAHGFPRIDERLVGLQNRYGYVIMDRDAPTERFAGTASVVTKYDLQTGDSTLHDFGPTSSPDEPVFVPRSADAAEDDGWLLSYVFDSATETSTFQILDATDVTAAPIAVIDLPQRVPHGFHGSWIPTAG